MIDQIIALRLHLCDPDTELALLHAANFTLTDRGKTDPFLLALRDAEQDDSNDGPATEREHDLTGLTRGLDEIIGETPPQAEPQTARCNAYDLLVDRIAMRPALTQAVTNVVLDVVGGPPDQRAVLAGGRGAQFVDETQALLHALAPLSAEAQIMMHRLIVA